MDFDLDLGQWIVIGLSAALFLWYFTANSFNRRRGVATYRWLYRALEQAGTIVHTEWIGSSNAGARLLVEKANKPLRKVYAMYLLEPREFLPYWIFSRLRRKRDEIVIRITLRKPPANNLEIHRSSRSSSDQASDLLDSASVVHPSFQITATNDRQVGSFEAFGQFLSEFEDALISIKLQTEAPHIECHMHIKQLIQTQADDFLPSITNIIDTKAQQESD